MSWYPRGKSIVESDTTEFLDFYVTRKITTTTLTTDIPLIGATSIQNNNVYTIGLDDTTGAAVGGMIEIWGPVFFFQAEITAFDASTVTLKMPVGWPFTTADVVYIGTADMDVDGSVTPVEFTFAPPSHSTIDFSITRFMITMVTATQPVDTKYGDLTALTNGIMYSGCGSIGGVLIYNNAFTVSDNGEYRERAYDVTYTERTTPATEYGVGVRKTFSGLDKSGTYIPNRRATSERFIATVQDNLNGLTRHRVLVQGHSEV
jgi:hypothetical protein